MSQKKLKEYRAIIRIGGRPNPGFRDTVMAADPEEAFDLFVEKHGQGNVFDVHNEEEASTIR